jgi:hypothetical protein
MAFYSLPAKRIIEENRLELYILAASVGTTNNPIALLSTIVVMFSLKANITAWSYRRATGIGGT